MYENPLENLTFEINLMEPFEERGLKGERDLIPFKLMKFYVESLLFSALKPSTIMVLDGVVH